MRCLLEFDRSTFAEWLYLELLDRPIEEFSVSCDGTSIRLEQIDRRSGSPSVREFDENVFPAVAFPAVRFDRNLAGIKPFRCVDDLGLAVFQNEFGVTDDTCVVLYVPAIADQTDRTGATAKVLRHGGHSRRNGNHECKDGNVFRAGYHIYSFAAGSERRPPFRMNTSRSIGQCPTEYCTPSTNDVEAIATRQGRGG